MTIDYYNQNADDFFINTVDVNMSALYERFLSRLPDGAHILDAGCGSGRDTKYFHSQGYRVSAFDASAELVKRAAEYTGLPISQDTFQSFISQERFDGIWACASLLHVPEVDLPNTVGKLLGTLKPGGVMYFSMKYGKGERLKDGRTFTDLDEDTLSQLINDLGYTHEFWVSTDVRSDRSEQWLNTLVHKA